MNMESEKSQWVLVSNRLPLCRKVDKWGQTSWKKTSGGLIAAMEPIVKKMKGVWVGWDGHSGVSDTLPPQDDYRICCVPLTEAEIKGYYDRFSNGTLWALFHYFFEKSSIDYQAWKIYEEVNRRFAVYVDQVASEGAIVWVQDYHLFLTPKYLKELRPDLKIHFFLHTPFPHNDIFSILPWKNSIIDSLLCCDSIGFHHTQYLENFKSTLQQELGNTQLYANPISIDFDKIDAVSRQPDVIKNAKHIHEAIKCPKYIIGVDRIDYSKGIKERLKAVELLLEEFPELMGQFNYYQLVIPSRGSVESYKCLKKEIDEIVGRINGRFSNDEWAPINYHYGTLPFEELITHYLAADIALVTPLRDGMNLVCKEYIASHSNNDGVLILSKFAGAYAEIKDCLAVNPYSIEEIKDAIHHAIHMPQRERAERMQKMRRAVSSHTIKDWFRECTLLNHPSRQK